MSTLCQKWLTIFCQKALNFVVNLPLKLFPATVANAGIGRLKSLHTLFDKYLDHMLVEFEQNYMVQTTRNFELFVKSKTKTNKQNKKAKRKKKKETIKTNKKIGFLKFL